MIKVSDYVVKRLAEYGIKHIFMVSGGGAIHLNDSIGKSKDIEYICNHHEQACAMSAEGYARINQDLAVVCVTTGCGGMNTLNGVLGQWTDSVPVLYISGQVKLETSIHSCLKIPLRQLGDQEVDIISIVKPITKYAEIVKEPNDIGRILDKAIYLATHGRKAPVWIDIPINIQGAMINEEDLTKYNSEDELIFEPIDAEIQQTIELLKSSKRPLIVAGHGIRLSKSEKAFYELIKKLQIPVVTTFNGMDILESSNPLWIGRIGTIGQRAGNFALQNADLVLFLGTRNNIRQISYNYECFAKNAKKIAVDIDKAELNKPTIKYDIAIHADLSDFIKDFSNKIAIVNNYSEWLNWCIERKYKYYPLKNPDYVKNNKNINPYYFIQVLTECLEEDSIIVMGNGTASVCPFQAGVVKKNQRFIWNSGCASMGYDLPTAIGACIANDKKQIICIAGDGSLMMNIQELQTIKHHKLPIKLFILNNDGYSSIKQTQNNLFEGRLVASTPETGVSMPDFTKVASAFGFHTEKLYNHNFLKQRIEEVLENPKPIVCEVIIEKDYIFSPKVSSEKLDDGTIISKPLEDMYSFLDREEFNNNMIL